MLCIVPPSVRGTRLSSSEEAFTLTGDRLYNPAWGWQDGRVRNSRVRRETVPLALAAYAVPLSASTSLAATLAAEAGVAKYSMLDWYDARTPMPDNYRYLPSYTGDRETEQAWLARDPRYTQIDWDELIRQNRMAGGHAVYALEDRVERLCNLAFDASFATEADARLTLRYGVSLRRENTRSYKQMRDLLGAGYVTDIDRFLIDDDTYGNLLQNDLRHPGRTVREGDRFGYDYALTLRGAALRLQADYRSDRFRADLSVVLGSDAVSRRGYYEKELFPGGQSYGPSRVMRFTPYTLKVAAGWAFTPRRYIEIAAAAAARTPRAGDLFFQPLYNNRTVDNPVPERIYAAELNCRLTGPVVDFQAALFAAMTLDGIETRTYYDDMASVYCDMAVTGVGRMSCGAEAAADIRLSYRCANMPTAFIELDDEAMAQLTGLLVDEYARRYLPEDTARFTYLLSRLKKSMARLLCYLRDEQRQSCFKPVACELKIGRGEDAVPPQLYHLSDGRTWPAHRYGGSGRRVGGRGRHPLGAGGGLQDRHQKTGPERGLLRAGLPDAAVSVQLDAGRQRPLYRGRTGGRALPAGRSGPRKHHPRQRRPQCGIQAGWSGAGRGKDLPGHGRRGNGPVSALWLSAGCEVLIRGTFLEGLTLAIRN